MRLPRDVSGKELAQALSTFGYSVVRQTGSHMRLVTTLRGDHHGLSRDEVAVRLFGSYLAAEDW